MSKIDIDDLRKTSAEIAGTLTDKPTGFNNIEEIVNIEEISQSASIPKPIRRVNYKKVPVENSVSVSSVSQAEISAKDCFMIGSLNVPKPTLFLAVILLVIGIVIWFMTKKNKEPERSRHPQEMQ
jgi:hypothetical protein